MNTLLSTPSSKLSERFAEQYQECQQAFSYVLTAARDRDTSREQFATLCGALNRKLMRLKEVGDDLAHVRSERE